MNKIAVGLILMGVFLGSTVISYADGVIVPFSIKVDSFKKEMKSHGMDLEGKDNSDGEIQNNGNSLKVITYRPVTMEQLEIIKQASIKTMRNNG